MKLIALFLLAATCHADALRLSNKYDSLSWGGFSLRKIHSRADGSWGLQLTQPHETPLEFTSGGDSGLPNIRNHIFLGIRDLLGGQSRQLIGAIWTGGAHCCHYYWIVDISSTARVIFDSRRYEQYELQPVDSVTDVDHDGIPELLFYNSLGAWHAAAFANWPSPLQIFQFDPVRYSYEPANHRFPEHATKELPALMRAIRERRTNDTPTDREQRVDRERQEGRVLEAALTLVYAGRGADAKTTIRKYSTLSWQQFLHELKEDPFYQGLLRNGLQRPGP